MSDAGPSLADRVAEMREVFDRSFADPRPDDTPPGEDLLAIRLGTEPYALRLTEIVGLHADRKITQLPGSVPTLLGIAGFRGAIMPVYDLPALLGQPGEVADRWIAIAAIAPVAFAFAVLDGHQRVAVDAIIAGEGGQQARQHVRHFARTSGILRPIVHLPSVLDAIKRQLSTSPNMEER